MNRTVTKLYGCGEHGHLSETGANTCIENYHERMKLAARVVAMERELDELKTELNKLNAYRGDAVVPL